MRLSLISLLLKLLKFSLVLALYFLLVLFIYKKKAYLKYYLLLIIPRLPPFSVRFNFV